MSTGLTKTAELAYFAQAACMIAYNRATSSYPARPTTPTYGGYLWSGPVQPPGMALGDHWIKTLT